MYKSFKFVLFNKSFPNPAKFWPEPDVSRICKKGRISAGAGAELRYSPSVKRPSSSLCHLRHFEIVYFTLYK